MAVKKLGIVENQPRCFPGASCTLATSRVETIVDFEGWFFPIHNLHNATLRRAYGIKFSVGKGEGTGIALGRCFDDTFVLSNRGEAKDMTRVWIECIDPTGCWIYNRVMGALELDPTNLFGLCGDLVFAWVGKGND